MRFQVPQFIEIEDKIFGPLTWKQFIYLAGGSGLCVIFYFTLPKIIAFLFIIPVAGLSLALAFYRVNKQPFIKVIENSFQYITSPRLYVWQKREKKREKKQEIKEQDVEEIVNGIPRVSNSKLKDMAWSLGVKESIYAETEEGKREGNVDLEAVTSNMGGDIERELKQRKEESQKVTEQQEETRRTMREEQGDKPQDEIPPSEPEGEQVTENTDGSEKEPDEAQKEQTETEKKRRKKRRPDDGTETLNRAAQEGVDGEGGSGEGGDIKSRLNLKI